MIIAALDPGTRETGCVLYNDTFSDPILRMEKLPNDRVLNFIFDAQNEWGVNLLAIEVIQSYGMPVGNEVFQTCIWVGRFIQKALSHDMRVWPVYRKPVVAWLTGTARGNDASVTRELVKRFGKEKVGRVGSDIRSAIAVALFAKYLMGIRQLPPNILG